ncbi:hypothetical protein [Streptomyces sp. URMC 123]|uniref:hypothetical protein n=1 Tax=Streptomyces sp. URMC 123 TaxID=3423403 RepID=UPI003F1B872F
MAAEQRGTVAAQQFLAAAVGVGDPAVLVEGEDAVREALGRLGGGDAGGGVDDDTDEAAGPGGGLLGAGGRLPGGGVRVGGVPVRQDLGPGGGERRCGDQPPPELDRPARGRYVGGPGRRRR